MAEGAKMAGASQGTAQQRAFTQEGVKGGRKGCTDPEMVDLSFQYRHTRNAEAKASRNVRMQCTHKELNINRRCD